MTTQRRTLAVAGISAILLVASGILAQTPAPEPAAGAGQKGGGKGGRGGGQGKRDLAPTTPTPRTADGKPDLSGNWAPNAIRENVDMVGAGVEVPMRPEALALYKVRKEALSKDDPEGLCLPPGVPRMSTTPYPWTIVQTPKLIVIVYEGGAHIWRKIFLDGRPHDPNAVETWLGDSTGHWEGDTLVVETVGQNAITWIDESGIPHSNEMVVEERFRRIDMGHMEIVHTITDPKTFTKPWSFTTHPTMLMDQKGNPSELIEYICQENNKDVQHLVGK